MSSHREFNSRFNIWAVGRNYAEHARELGHTAPSGPPMIFLKAGSGSVGPGQTLTLPTWSSDVQHECELVFRFDAALKLDAITIGLDLTARDIQQKLKEQQHPWTLAKSFRDSSAIGDFVPLSGLSVETLEFSLTVNGARRQQGSARQMLHSPYSLAEYVAERFPVVPGDLLFTGTPAGVAKLNSSDRLEAEIAGILKAQWRIA